MNEQEYQQSQARPQRLNRKSQWPKTLGIITLMFGIFGGLKGLMSIASGFFSEMMAKAANMPADFYEKWRPFMLGSGAVEICLGALLFLGAALLLFRKRFSMIVLVFWALLKMLVGVVGGFFSYMMQQEQLPLLMEQQKKAMEKASGAGGAAGAEQVMDMVSGATEVFSTLFLVAGLLWVMVLPLFILIWFIRPKIRKEMATWSSEQE